jgi:hypothetical protein
VKAVQVRLGHESAIETLNTYGHLWPSGDDDVRDAVEDVLGPVLKESSKVRTKGKDGQRLCKGEIGTKPQVSGGA